MTAIEVREIQPGDLVGVGRLLLEAYDRSGPFDEPYRRFLADAERWVPGATTVFVAERDGRVVGVVAFTLPGDREFETMLLPVADCGFRFLAVDPTAQRAGAGRALVRACLDAAGEHGCRRMVIHSMWFMTAAHRLYERLGFVRRPDLDVRFPSGVGYAFQRDVAPDADQHFPPPDAVPDEPPWYEDVWRGV
ncbi:MAG: GNAT family N-acetyltransferase [Actinomycetota bacterium]|nr:GNAT family N-acetyltransferase [Actinomycetota bacterium]